MTALDPEDSKIITLARAARARVAASAGGCVRDSDGRTYSGVSVDLPAQRIDALTLAVAQAVAGGAEGLEAAAWVSPDPLPPAGVSAVRAVGGAGTPILVTATMTGHDDVRAEQA